MSTNIITVPGDDNVELEDLKNWALTISWCSKAIIDVFTDDSISDKTDPGIEYLTLNAGEIKTLTAADPSTDYWYYSDKFLLATGSGLLTKTTFDMEATTYGGDIVAETTVCSGNSWYTWYDTTWAYMDDPEDIPADFPNGFLDRRKLEKTSPAFQEGREAQVRIKIKTNGSGFGGYVDYVAFLTNPDLFE